MSPTRRDPRPGTVPAAAAAADPAPSGHFPPPSEWTPWSLQEIHPDPGNPNVMEEPELARLMHSLSRFGPVEPAVLRPDGTLIGGHHRVEAARRLGWTHYPAVVQALDDGDAHALALALNHVRGHADAARLAAYLQGIADAGVDLRDTGVDPDYLHSLLADHAGGGSGPGSGPGATGNGDDPDDHPPDPHDALVAAALYDQTLPMPTAAFASRTGTEWRIGDRHRLICGDGTQIGWPQRALAAADVDQAAAVWTALPHRPFDDRPLHQLYLATAAVLDATLRPGAPAYVLYPPTREGLDAPTALQYNGLRHHQTLVWIAPDALDTEALTPSDLAFCRTGPGDRHAPWEVFPDAYAYAHAPIVLAYAPAPPGSGRSGRGGRFWYGDNSATSVLRVPRPRGWLLHGFAPPAALVAHLLLNSTAPGDVVLDPHAGAGAAPLLFAAEATGRTAALVCQDPGLCDTILHRAAAVGLDAVRFDDGVPFRSLLGDQP